MITIASEAEIKERRMTKKKKKKELRNKRRAYLLTELEIDRLSIAADAVQHPGLDAAPAHSVGTQLTGTPVWGQTEDMYIFGTKHMLFKSSLLMEL